MELSQDIKNLAKELPVERDRVDETGYKTKAHSFSASSVFAKPKKVIERSESSTQPTETYTPKEVKQTDKIKIKEYLPWECHKNNSGFLSKEDLEDCSVNCHPSDENFRIWREHIFASPITMEQFEKVRNSRNYTLLM